MTLLRKATLIILLVFYAISSVAIAAYIPDPHFISYKTEQGLSNDTVMSIVQDHEGIMWFGTEDGLSRFNGYEFKVYRYQEGKLGGLPGKQVQSLFVDSNNNLWVGTETGGVGLYNRDSDSFIPFSVEQGLNHYNIQEITEIDGVLWLSTDVGISLLDITTKAISHIPFGADNPRGTNHKWIREIVDDGDFVWVGTWGGGLNRFNKKTQTFTYYRAGEAANTLTSDVVYKVHKDKAGNIWAGTLESGLNRYLPECDCFVRYQYDSRKSGTISSDGINGFVDDKDGNLWVLTSNGPSIYDPKTDDFSNLKLLTREESGQLNRQSVSGYLSRDNTLWIASYNLGVVSISAEAAQFSSYLYSKELPNHLIAGNVLSLLETQGALFTGTDKGIYRYSFNHLGQLSIEQSALDFSVYKVIKSEKTQSLWLATANGVYEMTEQFEVLSHYDHSRIMPHSITQGRMHDIVESSSGDLYIANWRGGLTKLNPTTEKISYINLEGAKDLSISPVDLNTLYINDEYLWVGARRGVYQVSLNQEDNVEFFQLSKDEHAPSIAVFHINQTSLGLMLATDQGLMKFDPTIGNFVKLELDLASDVIQAIHQQGQYLWLSTYKGLFKWHVEQEKLSGYYSNQGTQGNVYNPKSVIATHDQRLLFGGKAGITLIKNHEYPLYQAKVDWRQPIVDKQVRQHSLGSTLSLPASTESISLRFQSDDYSLPEAQAFRYRINQGHWVKLKYATSIQIIEPSTGYYQVELQVRNVNSDWAKAKTSFDFHILPPWYLSYWALSLFAVALLVVFYLIYQTRTANIRKRSALLQQRVDEQTAELAAMLEQKNQLFANISHELRTPITLINAPIEQLALQTNLSEEQSKLVNLAQNNGKRLFSLVERILHLTKVEQQQKQKQLIHIDALLTRYVIAFEPLFQQKQIQLQQDFSSNAAFIADKDDVISILENLFSNALKYTETGGWVKVAASVIGGEYKLTISNKHDKLSHDEVAKIFNRFERLGQSDSEPGFGLGLTLVKQICNDYQWQINCKSDAKSVAFEWVLNDFSIEVPPHSSAQSQLLELGINKERSKVIDKQSLLIVEDNTELRTFLEDLLKAKYQIITAPDGESGLKLAIEAIPDLVISDVMMPKMDGFALVKALAEHDNTSHIPTILLTAKADEQSELLGLELGAVDYISKPFEAKQLLLKVKNTLAKQKSLLKGQLKQANSNTPNKVVNEREQRFVDRLNLALEQNYQDSLFNVEKLVDVAAMSERQLQRKLKALFNQTPAEYIRNYRLIKAKELLLAGKTISFVSDTVGFNSSSYFSRSFKAAFGQSPKEFISTEKK